ncbi:hypothetical protein ACAG26_16130 [Mycobacterium sp. pUA109]|uniref:hypothetical protein n=1 Tax=Mycobacterium sp. pUA109 TaxID=3238982 RepID=UPI00351BAAF0
MAFAIGFAIHGLDHLRRGMSASPPAVMVGGTVQAVFVVLAVVLALRNHPRARRAAVLAGFGSAVLFSYAHLLPTIWPGYQDSFVSPPHTNVTWFSWLSAVAEVGTGIVVGGAGIAATRRDRSATPPPYCESLPVDC